jgi:hypothetical protein
MFSVLVKLLRGVDYGQNVFHGDFGLDVVDGAKVVSSTGAQIGDPHGGDYAFSSAVPHIEGRCRFCSRLFIRIWANSHSDVAECEISAHMEKLTRALNFFLTSIKPFVRVPLG